MLLESENDAVLQEDLDRIANSNLPFGKLKDSTVLITGATGLIGSQLAKALAACNRIRNLNLKICILVRSQEMAELIFSDLLKRADMEVIKGDILNPYTEYIAEKEKIDYIFHTASVTASKMMVEQPVNTINTSLNGTSNILELARAKKCKGVVYVSSMEMYGKFEKKGEESPYIDEETLGYINPLEVRSNYPESKRMCENMCVAYAKQYDLPVSIARLSQTFGAGIL